MSFLSLPNEMIQMIFRELNDLNVMLNCRLVSRRCKQVVDSIRIAHLAVDILKPDGLRIMSLNPDNYKIGDSISLKSVIFRTASLRFFKSKLLKMMFFKLKKLTISCVSIRYKTEFDQFQTNVNNLNELEHLQIGLINLGREWDLQFNHIRTFAILHTYEPSIRLTAPQLTKLVLLTNSIWAIQVANANRLSHLILSTSAAAALSSYPKDRIEYLRMVKNPSKRTDLHQFIHAHPALRELHVRLMNKEAVCELLKQKRIARNLHLVIYLDGLPLDDLKDAELLFRNRTRLQMIPFLYLVEKFDRIHQIDWIKFVIYSELIRYYDRLSADAFLAKFNGIEIVKVCRMVDSEANFIEFLKKSKNLKMLVIKKPPFGQAFYDNLHTHCAHLQVLDIETEPEQITNAEFLLNHKQLRKLIINRDLDFALVNRLIRSNPDRLYSFRFHLKGIWVKLSREHNIWHFNFKSGLFGHTFNYSSSLNVQFDVIAALNDLFSLVQV